MGEIARLGLILMAVALIAALSLGYINGMTEPIIEMQRELEKQAAMTEVTSVLAPEEDGGGLVFDTLAVPGLSNPYAIADEVLGVVEVTDSLLGDRLGYAFVAYGKGYSSTVETMVGVDLSGRVIGVTILSQQETPGLGAKAEDEEWIGQFIDRSGSDCLVDRDGGLIHSITGATITSRTVANSVRAGLVAMDNAGLFDARDREGGI